MQNADLNIETASNDEALTPPSDQFGSVYVFGEKRPCNNDIPWKWNGTWTNLGLFENTLSVGRTGSMTNRKPTFSECVRSRHSMQVLLKNERDFPRMSLRFD